MKYRTLAAALLLGSVMFTSCVDEFSELNSDPSTITKPGRKQQFHQEVIQLVQIV